MTERRSAEELTRADVEKALLILGAIWDGELQGQTPEQSAEITVAAGLDVRNEADRLGLLIARMSLKLWRDAQDAGIAHDPCAPLASLRIFAEAKAAQAARR